MIRVDKVMLNVTFLLYMFSYKYVHVYICPVYFILIKVKRVYKKASHKPLMLDIKYVLLGKICFNNYIWYP